VLTPLLCGISCAVTDDGGREDKFTVQGLEQTDRQTYGHQTAVLQLSSVYAAGVIKLKFYGSSLLAAFS